MTSHKEIIGNWFQPPSQMSSKRKALSLMSSKEFGHLKGKELPVVSSLNTKADSVPMEDNRLPTPIGRPSVSGPMGNTKNNSVSCTDQGMESKIH